MKQTTFSADMTDKPNQLDWKQELKREFGELYSAGGGGNNGVSLPQSAVCTKELIDYIQAHFVPISSVKEAIGEDDVLRDRSDMLIGVYNRNKGRNELRSELRTKLLGEE